MRISPYLLVPSIRGRKFDISPKIFSTYAFLCWTQLQKYSGYARIIYQRSFEHQINTPLIYFVLDRNQRAFFKLPTPFKRGDLYKIFANFYDIPAKVPTFWSVQHCPVICCMHALISTEHPQFVPCLDALENFWINLISMTVIISSVRQPIRLGTDCC